MTDLVAIIVGAFGLLAGGWGVVTTLINRKASPYGELAKRVVQLEQSDDEKSRRIDALEGEVTGLKKERDADRALHAEAVTSWRNRVKRLLEHIDYLYAYITVHGSQEAPRPDDLPEDLRTI